MVRGPDELVTAPNPQANGPGQLGSLPAAWNGTPNGVANPPGDWKMCRLKALKNEALKSTLALSAILVFFPIVKSSFFEVKLRACGKDRPSLAKVKSAGKEKAAGLKNGVVSGLKLELLFV